VLSKKRTRNFAVRGIPTNDPLARKLWIASVIQGHRNPFGKALRDYTVAELDFVLEMAALDDPEHYSFSRAGAKDAPAAAMTGWVNVLREPLKQRYLELIGVAQGIRSVAAWQARATGGLKPGFSRKTPSADGPGG
jgi:hypothetical protein